MLEFINNIKKVKGPRKHEVSGSNGVYDAYKYIRKNKWFDIGKPISEHDFYTIIRQVNNLLVDELLRGNDVKLPHKLGKLELRKYEKKISFVNGNLRTNLPIDWNTTLRLWAEDPEAYKDKTLVRLEEKEVFKIFYNKSKANYNNKSFYEFEANRDLKRKLKQNIKDGLIDAFKF
jgi:hypothetical protein